MFYGHIGGMDTLARALIIADNILQKSSIEELRRKRYETFDSGTGKSFEGGKLTLEELANYAIDNPETKQISGQQELYECIINQYIR